MLRSETQNRETEDAVLTAFRALNPEHDSIPVFEHGQWWITCRRCGGQWSANDAEVICDECSNDPGPAWVSGGFCFELVTLGDEEVC